MKRKFYILSLGVGAMLLATNHAYAQNVHCADHAAMADRLSSQYGESRQAMGLGANNMVMEIYTSPDSGTWTVTMTAPGGPTCLVAAGENFQLGGDLLKDTDSGA